MISFNASQTNLITVVVYDSNNLEYYPHTGDLIVTDQISFKMDDFGSRSIYIEPNAITDEVETNCSISKEIDKKEAKVKYIITDQSIAVLTEIESIYENKRKKINSIKVTIPNISFGVVSKTHICIIRKPI